MARKKRIDQAFYVSWIAKENDPWWGWNRPSNAADSSRQYRSADDPVWPGIPERSVDDEVLIDTGPTLATLFHPNSRFQNLDNADRFYLLYRSEPDDPEPYQKLQEVIAQIIAARTAQGAEIDDSKIVFVPIEGIENPTDHEQIIVALRQWMRESRDDPFGFQREIRNNKSRLITVNLSPGTPAMHASWLLLSWSGALGMPPDTVLTFIQGDGGIRSQSYRNENERRPIIDVQVDQLSRMLPLPRRTTDDEQPPAPEFLTLGEIRHPLFASLRQQIHKAALLGLPIVLEGRRGTGKTMLAKYYHDRRQEFRAQQPSSQQEEPPKDVRIPNKSGSFVPVTLSEFEGGEHLRAALFGWKKGSFTGAIEESLGWLGEAHLGTLLLDEIHHLEKQLQAVLLRPLNRGRYRPRGADIDVYSDFDLVVATNRVDWEDTLADDFRDRIKRIVLHVPSFDEIKESDPQGDVIWQFWEFTLRQRCHNCGVEYVPPPDECAEELRGWFLHSPLSGNWRDLQRLADHVLLRLVQEQAGRPTPLQWELAPLKDATKNSLNPTS